VKGRGKGGDIGREGRIDGMGVEMRKFKRERVVSSLDRILAFDPEQASYSCVGQSVSSVTAQVNPPSRTQTSNSGTPNTSSLYFLFLRKISCYSIFISTKSKYTIIPVRVTCICRM